jgi:excisionase family DNA binding protein
MQQLLIDNKTISRISSKVLYMKQYLNASEVAKLLKVDRATVTRWAQEGKLKGAIRMGKSHQWRIPLSSFEELVKGRT